MPARLFAGDIGLCLIAPSFSKIASAPTRFAEFLAAGMPVLVTSSVGDLEAIVEDNRVGVVLRGDDDDAIASGARSLRSLMAEEDLSERCRRVASDNFDVVAGSDRYAAIYERLSRDG
jgi:glycosyltransferase involved in cell wall biosynthesis